MSEAERRVYLDYNATTPVSPEVFEAMVPFLRDELGNPSSIHRWGRRAQDALAASRAAVADFIGARSEDIVFTGGGTEADNLAILATAAASGSRGRRHVVISTVEHHAVLEAARRLEQRGWDVTLVDVDPECRVDPARLKEALRSDTLLVSVMYANNETGVVQPIRELARAAHDVGALFHTDAVQACGKIPVDVGTLDVDLLSLSAHKFYGPKGVGALYLGSSVAFEPLFFGGGQERSRRPGTENLPAIVGLAEACRQASARVGVESKNLARLRDGLQREILERIDGSHLNGGGAERTPNTLNVRFDGIDGKELVLALDGAGFGVSTGAACTAGGTGSHVLTAMGLDADAVRGSIRISLGRYTEKEEIRDFADALSDVVDVVRDRRSFARAR